MEMKSSDTFILGNPTKCIINNHVTKRRRSEQSKGYAMPLLIQSSMSLMYSDCFG